MADYKHSSKDGKLFQRKLYGFEAQAAYFCQEGEGFTMYPGGLSVKLGTPRTRAELEGPLRNAWLRARHLVPAIASKLVRHADGTDWFEYEVPASNAEAEKWAESTIVWHDETKKLIDFDVELADVYWKPTDAHYNVELHISPAPKEEGDWQFFYVAPHLAIDARSLMKLMEHVFDYLLEGLASPQSTPKLAWGEETARLPPTLAGCTGLEIDDKSTQGPPAPPPGFIPFLPIVKVNKDAKPTDHTNIGSLVVLDPEETKKFRKAAKEHGRTVTVLMHAFLALAETETALRLAIESGDAETYEKTVGAYEQATHFLFGFTFVNHRHKLEGYKSLQSPNGTPLFAVDGTSMVWDMNALRKAVKFDKSSKKVIREVSDDAIWDGVVAVSGAAQAGIPTSFEALHAREAEKHASLASHNDAALDMRALMVSSIGDYKQMDILNKYLPGVNKELSVTQLNHSIRNTHPLLVPIVWQYNERLSFYFNTARKFHTQEQLDLYTKIFREWIHDVVLSKY
ncbi:hypothetical protein PLICRDRAFT_179481 [Plicaturopsis crispa FD-325 SS-3]|uniref:Condensation domain-containing protein n=1 Tax=Plicaturopsis crispa FD-325 SS-3 TaxID=944288 RepID=A0A0C9T8W6_PLICR|nr:hypothetical protein PLICRDRAFT_179481 [Plicaturopsis crispa FD-325 SS-3]